MYDTYTDFNGSFNGLFQRACIVHGIVYKVIELIFLNLFISFKMHHIAENAC